MRGTGRAFGSIGLVVGIALVLAACASKASPGASASSSSPATPVVINATSVGSVGTVLVTSSGRTLYTLSADQGGKVTCTSSACTSLWPPLLLSSGAKATAGSGVDSSKLGTATTPSGAQQVTYNNWPLYEYSGDSGPGQANGQGINSFGGVWHPIAPSGKRITGATSSSPSPTGSGYGY